jgi:hypothetical protein
MFNIIYIIIVFFVVVVTLDCIGILLSLRILITAEIFDIIIFIYYYI